ncbi:MAG TPA: cytidine deaminase [Bacteroidetes bacterium]|nr:cytidine deaminase [Bacteroidota bacterium]
MSDHKKTAAVADSVLKTAALSARALAIAPYSGFRVGAALSTADGKTYEAGNIESSSYSLTLCAERVALFKALSEGERAFETIAIASDTEEFCSPCGACRQVLWDYARDIRVILVNRAGDTREMPLSDLLPHAFDDRMF